jgi:hypothetical protein
LQEKTTVYQVILENKIKNISFKNIDNAELSEISEIVLKKLIENNLEVILENQNDFDFALKLIGEQINDSKYSLIERFTEGLQEGLQAILECFKAVLEYFKENINFSEFEEEKIKKLSEEMIDDFNFEEKEFSENRSELN